VVPLATPHPAKVRYRGENGQIGAQVEGRDRENSDPKVKIEDFTLFLKKRPRRCGIEEVGREARGEPSFPQDP
jgi:hypothetical protein